MKNKLLINGSLDKASSLPLNPPKINTQREKREGNGLPSLLFTFLPFPRPSTSLQLSFLSTKTWFQNLHFHLLFQAHSSPISTKNLTSNNPCFSTRHNPTSKPELKPLKGQWFSIPRWEIWVLLQKLYLGQSQKLQSLTASQEFLWCKVCFSCENGWVFEFM